MLRTISVGLGVVAPFATACTAGLFSDQRPTPKRGLNSQRRRRGQGHTKKTILVVIGVLLVSSSAWGKVLLEEEIERGVWRVRYRHAEILRYEAYRKATCNIVRLAQKHGYSNVAIEDPWVGEENWPRPMEYTFTLEGNVRFLAEPVAEGLPSIVNLERMLMCGEWTTEYLWDSNTVLALQQAWGTPERVRDFWRVHLGPGYTINASSGKIVPGRLSLSFRRAPDEVEVSLSCRLWNRGTLSWEVYDPTGEVVWEGATEQRKLREQKRLPGASGEWGCRLNLDVPNGQCEVKIGGVWE